MRITNLLRTVSILLITSSALAQIPAPSPGTTEWRFTGDSGLLIDATGGFATLEYADGAGGQTSMMDTFTTTQAAGIPDIGGVNAAILHFMPHIPNTVGYQIRPNVAIDPEQFTMVFDLFIPASTTDAYMGLWNGNNENLNDVELALHITSLGFWNLGPSGGSGQVAPGTWSLGTWFRVVYVNDHLNGFTECYVDGVFAFTDSSPDYLYGGLAGGNACWILCDDNGDVTEGYIANFAYTEVLLDAAQAAALGGPNADGVFTYGGTLGTPYCASNANSTGSPAAITAAGSTSVLDADLTLTSEPVPNQPGIFFYAPSQIEVPFGHGFLCVSGGIARLPVVFAGSNTVSYTLDFAGLPASGQIHPGDTWNFQFWYRDPAAGGAAFNTSNGISIVFAP